MRNVESSYSVVSLSAPFPSKTATGPGIRRTTGRLLSAFAGSRIYGGRCGLWSWRTAARLTSASPTCPDLAMVIGRLSRNTCAESTTVKRLAESWQSGTTSEAAFRRKHRSAQALLSQTNNPVATSGLRRSESSKKELVSRVRGFLVHVTNRFRAHDDSCQPDEHGRAAEQ